MNTLHDIKLAGVVDTAENKKGKKKNSGASPVAQWLGIRLPMQGTRVRALIQEDPTCCRAAGPMHHNY